MTGPAGRPGAGGPAPIRWARGDDGVVLLTLDDPARPVNTLTAAYLDQMDAVLDRLVAERDAVTGVILTSAKASFCTGADLEALVAATGNAAQVAALAGRASAQLRRLETLRRPVVAAINGSALGGGLALALACHHRIVCRGEQGGERRDIEIGLPEVALGLLPGGGGVVRTVRLLGLMEALTKVLLRGERYAPAEALAAGLVHEVVDSPELLLPRAREYIATHPDACQPWDADGYRLPGGTPASPALAAVLPTLPATLRKQLRGAPYPAPHHILCAAVEGAQVDLATALAIEDRYFVDLARGRAAQNMIKLYLHDQRAVEARAPGAARDRAGTGGLPPAAGPPPPPEGFAGRLLGAFVAEGVAMLGEGLHPASIEQAGDQAGFETPALARADELSLTLLRNAWHLAGAAVAADATRDAGPAGAVIDRMIDGYGRSGSPAGAGFYEYVEARRERLWPGLYEYFTAPRRRISFVDMRDRLLFVPAIEAVRCVEEGVLTFVPEANVDSVRYSGFPAWTGGALRFIDQYAGAAAGFARRADELAARYGARFAPPPLLRSKAARGDVFG